MSSPLTIATSGLQAAQQRLNASAHNVANLGTPQAQRLRVETSAAASGGVNASTRRDVQTGVVLEQELVDAKEATYAFQANLKMIQAQDRLLGSLFDAKA